jgi:O-antigen/teichoic acid export membrane protein
LGGAEKHNQSIRWSTGSTLLIALSQVILLFALTRLATPADFGLMALFQTLNAFVFLVLDFGFSTILIVESDLNLAQKRAISRVFWAIGLFCALLLLCCAAWQPELWPYFVVCALNALFLAFGLHPKAILRRQLRFDRLGSIECLAFFTGASLTFFLAHFQGGAWAMLMGIFCTNVLSTLLYLWSEPESLHAKVASDWSYVRRKMNFGAFQIADRFVTFLHERADGLLISYLMGAESLGVYDVFKQSLNRFSGLVSTAMSPVYLSALGRSSHEVQLMRARFLGLLQGVALLSLPAYLFALLLAQPLCFLFFGTQWTASTLVFQVLALVYLIRSTAMFSLLPALALGKGQLGFYWNSVHALISLPLSALGLCVAGLEGLAFALLLAQILLFYPNFRYLLAPYLHIDFLQYLNIYIVAGKVALATLSAAALTCFLFPVATCGVCASMDP